MLPDPTVTDMRRQSEEDADKGPQSTPPQLRWDKQKAVLRKKFTNLLKEQAARLAHSGPQGPSPSVPSSTIPQVPITLPPMFTVSIDVDEEARPSPTPNLSA